MKVKMLQAFLLIVCFVDLSFAVDKTWIELCGVFETKKDVVDVPVKDFPRFWSKLTKRLSTERGLYTDRRPWDEDLSLLYNGMCKAAEGKGIRLRAWIYRLSKVSSNESIWGFVVDFVEEERSRLVERKDLLRVKEESQHARNRMDLVTKQKQKLKTELLQLQSKVDASLRVLAAPLSLELDKFKEKLELLAKQQAANKKAVDEQSKAHETARMALKMKQKELLDISSTTLENDPRAIAEKVKIRMAEIELERRYRMLELAKSDLVRLLDPSKWTNPRVHGLEAEIKKMSLKRSSYHARVLHLIGLSTDKKQAILREKNLLIGLEKEKGQASGERRKILKRSIKELEREIDDLNDELEILEEKTQALQKDIRKMDKSLVDLREDLEDAIKSSYPDDSTINLVKAQVELRKEEKRAAENLLQQTRKNYSSFLINLQKVRTQQALRLKHEITVLLRDTASIKREIERLGSNALVLKSKRNMAQMDYDAVSLKIEKYVKIARAPYEQRFGELNKELEVTKKWVNELDETLNNLLKEKNHIKELLKKLWETSKGHWKLALSKLLG